jgi:hypothetical protein
VVARDRILGSLRRPVKKVDLWWNTFEAEGVLKLRPPADAHPRAGLTPPLWARRTRGALNCLLP